MYCSLLCQDFLYRFDFWNDDAFGILCENYEVENIPSPNVTYVKQVFLC